MHGRHVKGNTSTLGLWPVKSANQSRFWANGWLAVEHKDVEGHSMGLYRYQARRQPQDGICH